MAHFSGQYTPARGLHPAALAAALAGLALAALVVLPLLTASHGGGRTLGRISTYVAGSDTITGAPAAHPLASNGAAAPNSAGGGGSRPLTVYNMPTVLVPLTSPSPVPPPAPAAAALPPEAPAAPAAEASTGAKVLDNPNNTVPPDLDPNRPFGPPVIRTDWVISKDYAAHGGHSEWGAIDFAYWYDRDAMGSEVVATHAGTVHLIPDDPIYGNWVWVSNDHFTTRYGHTRKYLVSEGQQVVRGTLLAEMGSTGNSTGPHVDYQVWQDNDNKNPMDFLK
jgi:murein DD-endopeptidase MepM/ murein hydrolase activator NlpD